MGGHLLWGDVCGNGDLFCPGRDLEQTSLERGPGMEGSLPWGLSPTTGGELSTVSLTSSGNSSPTSDRISDVFPTWAAQGGAVSTAAKVGESPLDTGPIPTPAAPTPTPSLGAYPRPAAGCARPASWRPPGDTSRSLPNPLPTLYPLSPHFRLPPTQPY